MSPGADSNASTPRRDWPSRLIRADDKDLEDLANTEFIDGGESFKLGAGDQALVAATFSYLFRRDAAGEVLVLALPRGAHDAALCVALAAQVTQLRQLATPIAALFSPWKGSIVVIGQNTGVQTRLGELQVRKAHLRGGVANALRAHRIRTDGRLSAPDGTVSAHDGGAGRLLYLNTRIQWPTLANERDPFVVIDATRLGAAHNLRKALDWAHAHGSRQIVVVAHLGDCGPIEELARSDQATWMFDLCSQARDDLIYELGHSANDARLSSNELLHLQPAGIRVREVADDELSEHLLAGLAPFSDIPGSRDTWPYPVIQAHRLLTGLRRLVDELDSYNRSAALDPYLTSFGGAFRMVERNAEIPRAQGTWRAFQTNHWGAVRNAAMSAYRIFETRNPKLDVLIDEIERALRDPDRRVIVRSADRLGAAGLPATISGRLGEAVMDRVSIARTGDVLPWLAADSGPVTEILPGAPSTWDGTWLFGGESTDRVILTYPFETNWVDRATRRTVARLNPRRAAFYDRFELGVPPSADTEVAMPAQSTGSAREAIVLTLPDLWQRILDLEEPVAGVEESNDQVVRHGPRSLQPNLRIRTDDGRVHLIPREHEVEVFIGGRYRIRLGSELIVGDQLLYTTGTGRDSLFTRLVAASHRTMRVDDLDLVMRRFRDACRTIKNREGSWAAGNRKLQGAGASAGTQLQSWAEGDTIAPEDPGDVRIVATLANDARLEGNWFRIEALASELRRLHRSLGRVLSAAIAEALEGGGPNVRRVTEMVGVDGAEILDEFTSATIVGVEPL